MGVAITYSNFTPSLRVQRHRGELEVIALPILNLGARRSRLVSATPRPLYPRERGPLPIVQEAGWVTGGGGGVWTGQDVCRCKTPLNAFHNSMYIEL
jgi:hypothetical protein